MPDLNPDDEIERPESSSRNTDSDAIAEAHGGAEQNGGTDGMDAGDTQDREAIVLLRKIFPDASQHELEDMHFSRISKGSRRNDEALVEQRDICEQPTTRPPSKVPNLTSNLGRRLLRTRHQQTLTDAALPDDFLRIPQSVAVRLQNSETGQMEWKLVSELERNVLSQHAADAISSSENGGTVSRLSLIPQQEKRANKAEDDTGFGTVDFTTVFCRDEIVGLGMAIKEHCGCIIVFALVCHDGVRITSYEGIKEYLKENGELGKKRMGPAYMAGIWPGDRILGINGIPLLKWELQAIHTSRSDLESPTTLLEPAAEILKNTPDPVVLTIRRAKEDPMRQSFCVEDSANGAFLIRSPTLSSAGEHDMATDTSVLQQIQRLQAFNEATPKTKKLQRPVHSDGEISFDQSESATAQNVAIHPLAIALMERGLLRSQSEEVVVTKQLEQYTERTRQWESSSRLRVDSSNFSLRQVFDPRDAPHSEVCHATSGTEEKTSPGSRSCAPSTPVRLPLNVGSTSCENLAGSNEEHTALAGYHEGKGARRVQRYPGSLMNRGVSASPLVDNDSYIELAAVRKAMSVRIVNQFQDNDRTAYTIWIYDCESSREWYAPVRYYEDFNDLRLATSRLSAAIAQLPFPCKGWFSVSAGSDLSRETRCRQLELFLRALCGIVYKWHLHPSLVEVAIHLQSFLGCDNCLGRAEGASSILHHQVLSSNSLYGRIDVVDGHTAPQNAARSQLKRSVQRYVYRIFLLPCMEELTTNFIDTMKAQTPSVTEMRVLERRSMTALKDRANASLKELQEFLDQLHDLIYDGCLNDLNLLTERCEFDALRKRLDSEAGNAYTEILFRDTIREQVEIEVYVPLRSAVSRILVNAWRHDDKEMVYKVKELQKRPQSYFNIRHQSPSEWRSVTKILKEGVGRSTLVHTKLRAVVDAAKEIVRLYAEEQQTSIDSGPNTHKIPSSNGVDQTSTKGNSNAQLENSSLGADEFLPIFIFCVVQAEIERQFALCILLRALCDRSRRIGETGYYLASFEAAITHIREIDLANESGEW